MQNDLKILIVATGQECFKGRFLAELTSMPYEFFLLVNSSARVSEGAWYNRYVLPMRTISADFRNPPEAARTVRDWFESRGIRLSGVTTYLEVAVLVTQAIAEELSLPPITTGNPLALRSKNVMRLQFAAAGLPQPQSIVCRTLCEALEAVERIGPPCVIKPSQMAGSVGVRKVSTYHEREIANAFNAALTSDITEEDTRYSFNIADEVIVEEYISTYQEVSCEGLIERGEVCLLAITKKMLGPEPHFEEIGHVTPYPATNEITGKLEGQLRKAANALKLFNTAFHAEFRLRQDADPVLIEIGARLPGGFIPYLVRLSKGVDMFNASLRLAVGQNYAAVPEDIATAAIRFLVDADSARKAASAADRIRALPFVADLTLYGGARSGRLGHIMWRANAFSEVEDAWSVIRETL
jgi:cysteine synthase A